MSLWQEHEFENKLRTILRDVPDFLETHHFGRPFLTAYQIAIEFAKLFPETTALLGLPIGGKGIHQKNSLAQYLARELSRRIKNREIVNIEGRFLSNLHLNDISFNQADDIIYSSLTDTQFTLSMFRLDE